MPSTDYAKLKNAELESLLKERGLPHTGKKAEMVSRLQQDDTKKKQEGAGRPQQQQQLAQQSNQTSTALEEANASAAVAEDEIDWDDDDAVAIETEKPDTTATSTVGKGTAEGAGATSTAAAAATSLSSEDKQPNDSTTNGTTAAGKSGADAAQDATDMPTEEGKSAATAPDTFASGLAATTIEEELAKRRARAKKFGLADESDQDAIKALERAKRFGETATGPRGLNEALPERMAKNHKKRGRGDRADDDGYDGQRNSGRRFGGGKGRFKGKGRNGGGGREGGGNSKPAWMSAADKERAEARQKRFAAAS